MQIKAIVQTVDNFLQKNSPYILTGLGCAGLVSTAVMTGKASVNAYEMVKEFEKNADWEHCNNDKLSWHDYQKNKLLERAKLTWKYFIPPVIMGSCSIACIIGAQSVNTKRNAALASLYTLTDQTLKEYQEKVVETIGKNKEQKIKDELAQDKLLAHPVNKHEIIHTSYGDTLCFDVYSGRYFTHDIEKLRRIQNDFNHDLMGVMWLPLNDLYYMIGLEEVKMGEDLGWTVDELLEFKFTSKLTDTGEPCLVIDYDLTPRFHYLNKSI